MSWLAIEPEFKSGIEEEVKKAEATQRIRWEKEMALRNAQSGGLRTAMEVFKTLESPNSPVEGSKFKLALLQKPGFDNDMVEKIIRTMFREGLIFESKPGFFRRAGM